MKKSWHINVRGVVQGVGFRYYTQQKANELNIFGNVRNMNDGSVKIVAQGGESELMMFLEWCHQGPTSSKVEELVYSKGISDANFDSFEIIR